ncbi:CopG family transcriptional regulator [Alcanivorax sp. S71-1-4]|uniref:type II toxin-antitoxin system BrnA family antitoxin n=1 Tax=Alcanivorax sp. S71-1-4 TaxID=1177159 RepID=UPI0013595D2B|nr:CopG family transcriptional regulator [Alcanivorax sp. S71-1-4]KAF0808837.1 CopG family transcriptional regulator [Alcanivorax sp. S71-1-4]
MKAKDFDRRFDDGEDVSAHLDPRQARRANTAQKRVNVDFPVWMIEALDREASRLGVTRQSIIKVWLAERLEQASQGSARYMIHDSDD